MKLLKYGWRVLMGLAYLAVVIGILSAASTRFETLVLAGMVEIYVTLVYYFSEAAVIATLNNRAGLVRFMILAKAQGITGNEDGTFEEQDKELVESIKKVTPAIWINRISNAAVSIFALFKIIQAAFFG